MLTLAPLTGTAAPIARTAYSSRGAAEALAAVDHVVIVGIIRRDDVTRRHEIYLCPGEHRPAHGRAPVVLVTLRWKFFHKIQTHTCAQPYNDQPIHYQWKASGAFIVADAAPGFPDGGVPYAFPLHDRIEN
ncbi:hypothetical protein [Oerskovia enterophila]|uniref:hypothetical protein n=1 Tax=Oerskovia enterophila TaxID=43678 RepID=UPI003392D97F